MAAGIVNPITGRRFVKSWRIEELLPAARKLYAELEDFLNVKIWHDLPLIRTLYNRGDENDWLARSADPGYPEYMDSRPDLGRLPKVTEPVFAYVGVRHAARVDIATLVESYRKKLKKEERFMEEEVNYQLFSFTETGVTYNRLHFDRIIFCEGWRARYNPWFGHLPHGGNKGEVLTVKTDAPLLQRMFKHRIFLVPRADGVYWIGATSENKFQDDSPTPANRQYLTDRLEEVLNVPFEVVDHQAAVRPTVRDRRPFLGVHPEHRNLFIFNGLGTKGASLAPLCSQWLFDYLEDEKSLPSEVDIRRWA